MLKKDTLSKTLPKTQQIENPTFLVDVLVKDCLSLIVQYNMWYYL